MDKIDKIEKIRDAWFGNFISDYVAMSEIDKILNTKTLDAKNLVCFDANTGEIIFTDNECTVNILP